MDPSASMDKARVWLNLSLFMLLISSSLYVIDYTRTDIQVFQEVKSKLQQDFHECILYYNQSSDERTYNPSIPVASELYYDQTGKLTKWSNNKLLQEDDKIHRLSSLPDKKIWESDKFIFYQIRKKIPSQTNGQYETYVALIPIFISYGIKNRFLVPYLFLGRCQNSSLFTDQDRKNLRISTGEHEQGMQIEDLEGDPTFSIEYVPLEKFRRSIRLSVLGFFILGIIFFFVFLRLYTLKKWNHRYIINLLLLFIVLLIRGTFHLLNLPNSYVDLELFKPTILSFSNLAPSLGDLTFNILTFLVTCWILKIYAFRLLNYSYRQVSNISVLGWILFFTVIVISGLLLKGYGIIFEKIIENSKIDVEFANVFAANVNSYLILLDVGLLLLAISFIIFTLLRFNIIFGLRFHFSITYILVNLLSIFIVCILLDLYDPLTGIMNAGVLSFFLIIIYRFPFKQILHQDLPNYLLIIMIFSTLVTYHVGKGIDQKGLRESQQIANQILGNQVDNTVFSFTNAQLDMSAYNEELQRKSKILPAKEFESWLKEKFLYPNFKASHIKLYIFNEDGTPFLDYDDSPSLFGPDSDLGLDDRAQLVPGTESLYQLPNFENRYADLYVAVFKKELSNDNEATFILELAPTRRETEGLYPSLSMEEMVYDDTKLINSYDHAIYLDGYLHYHKGEIDFPLSIAEDLKHLETYKLFTKNGYYEYIQNIDKNKIVVIRYPQQSLFNIVSLFSFIFYFYIFSTLLIIALPVYLLRSLNAMPFSFQFPLRTKIRIGLLIISTLPMFIIIAFLFPFIQERYEKQAKEELIDEADRIADLLGEDYIFWYNDHIGKYSRLKAFRKRIHDLESIVKNDINVFDVNGKRLVSTQPLIFESGLSSDLMNAEAYKELSVGERSYLVVKEQIGKLKYLSCYWPIVGNNATPIGYINVTYIAKQDQLEEQVLDFLAYLINIYLLVFLLINLVAVLASDAISKPLSLIQQRLSNINLGHVNKPIDYTSRDEIGAIVNAYNAMVSKLADSEKKLAQTERELAWRQMARQVAHEIKNPLTPMKLSIQHLSRAWQEQAKSLDRMFPRVMKTLLVQIETMVRIANSFSEFAKMPEPSKSHVILNDILLEVVDLFAQTEEAMWLIDIPPKKFAVYADRDQLSRCFNNLIKNGLQAIEQDGIMHISMEIQGEWAKVEIRDNGKGIPLEIQERVFEPSFSTKSSGMGLGLAMVKRIIELCDGRIYFSSIINEGTSFFIELPSAGLHEDNHPTSPSVKLSSTQYGPGNSASNHNSVNGNGRH